jgi:hypothetical protein
LIKEEGFEGFNILNNNFEASGQTVKHVHFHIMSRFKEDSYFPEPMWGIKQREANLKLPNFEGIHHIYSHFGRIIRDEENQIAKIVEFKDASEDEKKVTELNPAIYCIQDKWLWKNLDKIKSNNNQKEYYLTDLVDLAYEQNIKINSFVINDGLELMGINTLEDLELAQKIYKEK